MTILSTRVVPGFGPMPADVLLVGEAPGAEEFKVGRPFVGRSGSEQDTYLARYGLSTRRWRLTNVVGEYREGNPDPTSDQIREWTPRLLEEVAATHPRLIVAVGRYSMRWFLGEAASLDTCWGVPHYAGAFDRTRANRGGGGRAIVIPIVHPAAGFYDSDVRSVIAEGYRRVAETYKLLKAGREREVEVRYDEWEGNEDYRDASGAEVAETLHSLGGSLWEQPPTVAIDTEGSEQNPFSIQLSVSPGAAMMLRCSRDDFDAGIAALQQLADSGATFVLHNAMHDLAVCRALGLDLSNSGAKIFDTMYGAYLLRLEPQGLKALAWRWCGMRMESYRETVGGADQDAQVEYLTEVLARGYADEWPTPEPRMVVQPDGSEKKYKPQSVTRRVEKILSDLGAGANTTKASEEEDDDAEAMSGGVDLAARWKSIDPELRAPVEEVLGPLPVASLDSIPLDRALHYAARDADATLRLYHRLVPALAAADLTTLMEHGMETLPVFEEMQATGLPASRSAFEELRDSMTEGMRKVQKRISAIYFEGRPFNPKSPKHVATLLRKQGLVAAKRTPTGAVSTGKQSIEHLRYEDPAIEAVFEYREKQHVRDMFCVPVLETMSERSDEDVVTVRCQLKVTRTTTRRLASKNPNLLAFPKHEKPGGEGYGQRVRDCFVCPEGEVFLESDLSQIELRMLAHESRDPLLCRLFRDGHDVHTETAARVFGVANEDVTKLQRFFAKRVSFGIAYGVSGMGLATQLRTMGITGAEWGEEECNRMIREWLKLYSGCAKYFDEVEREVARTGEVRDCWGMRRYLPGVWSLDKKVAAEARRQAVNHRIQGGAQGMIQRSMAWLRPVVRGLQEDGVNVHWCLQLHDALLLRMDEEVVDFVEPVVREGLTKHCGVRLRVPVLADSKVAKSWGGL